MTHNFADITGFQTREFTIDDYEYWLTYGITKEMLEHDGIFCISSFTHGFFKNNPYLTYTRSYSQCYGKKFGRKTIIYMPNQKPNYYSNIIPGEAYWFQKYPKKNKELWIVDNYIEGRMLLNHGYDVRGIIPPGTMDFSILDVYRQHWPVINYLLRGSTSYANRAMKYIQSDVNFYSVDTFFLSRHILDLISISHAFGIDTVHEAIDGLVLLS